MAQGGDIGLLKAPFLLLPLPQFTHLSPNTAIASKIVFLSVLAVLTEQLNPPKVPLYFKAALSADHFWTDLESHA